MKYQIILFCLFIFCVSNAERIIHIHLKNKTVTYPFSEVKELTFPMEKIIVHKQTEEKEEYNQSQLDSISYSEGIATSTMTDQDGNIYQTVKIGNQWWMAENLKVTTYRDGTAIAKVIDNNTWKTLTSGGFCAYNNVEENVDTYGYLYNWYVISDSRNIAPEGWHVPTDEEWKELEKCLGMSQEVSNSSGWRGTTEGCKLAGNSAIWTDGVLDQNSAFDSSGFSALPGGYRSNNDFFDDLGNFGHFWSSSESGLNFAMYRTISYMHTNILRASYITRYGFSVRLVRDN